MISKIVQVFITNKVDPTVPLQVILRSLSIDFVRDLPVSVVILISLSIDFVRDLPVSVVVYLGMF